MAVDRACFLRLQKEYRTLCKEPVPHVVAKPNPENILEWHYVIEGTEGTAYEGGFYYGIVKFPREYPFKPPTITMVTPSGRFATNTRICMSMTDFHPETWNPMWSVSSILTGLLSFMLDNISTTGSIGSTVEEKRLLAKNSLAFNCRSRTFRNVFPEYVEKFKGSRQGQEKEEAKKNQERNRGSRGERMGGEKTDTAVADTPLAEEEEEKSDQHNDEAAGAQKVAEAEVSQTATELQSREAPVGRREEKLHQWPNRHHRRLQAVLQGDQNVKEAAGKAGQASGSGSGFPLWLTALLLAILASVMALPLLSLEAALPSQ